MRAALLTLALLGLGAAPALPARKAPPPDAPQRPKVEPGSLSLGAAPAAVAGTRCAACHQTSNWSDVKFNHDRTGFSLRGKHLKTSCKGCHRLDFSATVPRACGGCHADGHAGELGQRCESCHDENSWQARFNADAHRRTNFPLLGAHAALPCQECHFEARERRFARPAVPCLGCHQMDVSRTRGTAVDHLQLGFPEQCLTCHGPVRFKPARFPGHDGCFLISAGAHAQLSCEQCHSTLASLNAAAGQCTTRSAICTSCHTHACTGPGGSLPTDTLHAQVQGYRCSDLKCYECHQLGAAGP